MSAGPDAIATLDVIATFANGREVGITVRIGRAQAIPEGGFVCAVQIAPVYAEALNVRGVDSFHATWLAFSLVLKLLGQLKDEGASLRHTDGSEFPLDAYMAGLDGTPGDAAGR